MEIASEMSSRSLKMSDDLSLLIMQLPQKSRLAHSDGRRGETKFCESWVTQKTKITESSPVPDISQVMLIYTTWQEPPAHSIKTVSTGEQQKVAMILVIGCVRILDKGMFSTRYSKDCQKNP